VSTPSLFGQAEGLLPEGFRLARFEVLNWGSFDGHVYRLTPEGSSCLLTGANGSGKTTLVDALVTLLVPPPRRHYNQSSGAEAKRERTEASYVQGAFGTLREEESLRRSTQYLRDTGTYSVLLGVFVDSASQTAVTLVQVRWFTGGNLQRTYAVIPGDRSIEDLQPVDKAGDWKKRLRDGAGARIFDSFQQYSQAFSGLFGLRSEKALTLFSQTVGVKVLGDLNHFIRTQMLEEQDFEAEFRKLEDNYDNLLSSHQEIEKAQDQLGLLTPVLEHGAGFRRLEAALTELDELDHAHPAIFARESRRQLLVDIAQGEKDLGESVAAREHADAALGRLTEERGALHAARATDSTAIRLQQIEQECRHLEERKAARKAAFERYNGLAQELGLPAPGSQADLHDCGARAQEARAGAAGRIREAANRVFELRKGIDATREALDELRAEIASLRSRRSNIPRRNLEIRALVAHGIGIAETELPFAGELIRVRPEEGPWEAAIEKLLHTFALCVLVPEDAYRAVNSFVRDNDLRGRLVYFRVPLRTARILERTPDPDSAVAKLEIKPKTPHRDWLEDHLRSAFDYHCTDDLEAFARLARGITRTGLIKNEARHEKDDRPVPPGGSGRVLGWDNTEKLTALAQQAVRLERALGESESQMAAADTEREEAERLKQNAERLAETTDYNDIDWRACVREIDGLRSERKRLLAASSGLKALEAELERVGREIGKLGQDRDRLIARIQSVGDQIDRHRAALADKETLLRTFDHVDLEPLATRLAPYVGQAFPIDGLAEIERRRESSRLGIRKERDRVGHEHADTLRQLEKAMQSFCQPRREIVEKYPGWSAEVLDLRPDASYLPEYERMHARIAKEDLPRYRRKFKQYLNDRMIEDLVSFNTGLHGALRDIEDAVEELNTSLAQILYTRNPPTYIEIETRPTADTGVRDLREMLRRGIGDAGRLGAQDEAELEHTFSRMKELVTALRDDELWRRNVLDVRNWLQFSVMERFQTDGSQRQYYQDSASLSGGEKAKLAYTILASAIAFQFGIRGTEPHTRSFRFVVVDEAFSKVDPENATYAMELFRTLQLQLMVVTPLDKINIVEDYVRAVHYVENRDRKRSAVYTMTLEVYRDRKKDYLHQARRLREEAS
jgi:uncharacterized protein YPO0396